MSKTVFSRQWSLYTLTILLASSFLAIAAGGDAKEVVRMTPKQSDNDVSHDYLDSALKAALEHSQEQFGDYQIEYMPIMLDQGLVLELLDIGGVLDVVAAAPTHEREAAFNSVKVPLFMGLLGYRMMIIRPEDQQKFANIQRPEELKSLRACQAKAWPDADILEEAGYSVVRVPQFEDNFGKLIDNGCDYFPRAITEGYGELAKYNHDNPEKPLAKFDKILLHYDVPLVFYTSQSNYELTARLEYGLSKMLENGELVKLLKTHPVTKQAFPLDKWKDVSIFEVANSSLPRSIPLYDEKLWLVIKSTE